MDSVKKKKKKNDESERYWCNFAKGREILRTRNCLHMINLKSTQMDFFFFFFFFFCKYSEKGGKYFHVRLITL